MSSPEPDDLDVPSYMVKRWNGDTFWYFDTRLETWSDPTPRESEFSVKDLRAAVIEAAKLNYGFIAMSKTMPSEEKVRLTKEHDRRVLMIALQVYTKQNNMQPADLDFVEVKERNLVCEYGEGYWHFNFLVKGLDGKHTMFFAEVCDVVKDDKHVYLCTPLGEDDFNPPNKNDQACCKGCKYRSKDLIHPSDGSFLGGHKCIALPPSDSDDERDEEFLI